MNIKFGDKNAEVKAFQEKLILLAYKIKADEDFGQKTLTALNNFQKLNGLSLTQSVDDSLIKLIDNDIEYNSKIDQPSIKRIMTMHPKVSFEVLHLFKQCHKKGLTIRVVQAYRTFAEQNALYAQGRTKPGPIVTNAKGGLSNHNYGLSFDFCLLKPNGSISWSLDDDLNDDGKKDWLQVVEIFKNNGFEWGGDWKFIDNPHIEKTFGYKIRQLLELHNSGKIDSEGYVII